MSIDVFLYVQEAITFDDLVASGHELEVTNEVELQVLHSDIEPKRTQINVVCEGMYVMCRLIRRGDFADWFLDDAQMEGAPFHPRAILSVAVYLDPIPRPGDLYDMSDAERRQFLSTHSDIALNLGSQVVALFAQKWTVVLDNLRAKEKHRIYSAQEILANSQLGLFPY